MSNVLIKGMEMPQDCPQCVAAHYNKLGAFTGCNVVPGKLYAIKDGQYAQSNTRPKWCPLVEVSDVYSWTPISTAEPPGGIHVLVTIQWEDDDLEVTELDYGLLKATRWPHLDKVIAWAPLPEPYKEGQAHGDAIYPCDPSKNTECRKTGCFKNGGPCSMTRHAEYATADGRWLRR